MTSGEEDMEDWDDDVGGEDAMEITLHALTSVEHTIVLESFQSMRQHASKASNVAIEDSVCIVKRRSGSNTTSSWPTSGEPGQIWRLVGRQKRPLASRLPSNPRLR
jgi:hypothetical protein